MKSSFQFIYIEVNLSQWPDRIFHLQENVKLHISIQLKAKNYLLFNVVSLFLS